MDLLFALKKSVKNKERRKMTNIFISYSRKNKSSTEALSDDIEGLGNTVWFDKKLSGGQPWWDKILENIRNCDVFVFVLSAESLDSSACTLEYEYADKLGKMILPVLIDEKVHTGCLPQALSKIQFVDYLKQDRDALLDLGKALNSAPPFRPNPDPLPSSPEFPISELSRLSEQIDDKSELSYEKQSTLVLDLKRNLHDPMNSDKARMLLIKLKKRPELRANIATLVNEILESTIMPTTMLAPHTTKIEHATTKQLHKREVPSTQDESEHLGWIERQMGALYGAILGIVMGAIVLSIAFPGDDMKLSLFSGVGGMIAGALSGKRWLVIVSALTGAASVVFLILLLQLQHTWSSDIVVYGMPIGAVYGAIVGGWISKKLGPLPFKN